MFTIGDHLRLTLFGQSHSPAIGGVIDGFPPGFRIDFEKVKSFMARRAPGRNLTTPRKEADEPRILSGLADDDVTCGAPLSFLIENTNTRSKDYSQLRDVPRPMHSDYPAAIKYGGHNDIRGGGHFSGRLTAPICFAGAVALQLLEARGIVIGSHIASVGSVRDERFNPMTVDADLLRRLATLDLPAMVPSAAAQMRTLIEDVRANQDSVGGTIEAAAVGVPAGLGDPLFDKLDSLIARILFSIPAVKGVEFGAGFDAAAMLGSDHNDAYEIAGNGSVRTKTNRHGGILGGISTGMPLILRAAFKPTPSIALPQDSVSLSRRENVKLTIEGRHDPCIVLRAAPVVEAAVALVLADRLIGSIGNAEFAMGMDD